MDAAEERRERDQAYHREYSRVWAAKNRDRKLAADRRWREANKERAALIRRQGERRRRRAIQHQIDTALGGKCAHCACTDERVLQVHHVNGDGAEHRHEANDARRYYLEVLRSALAGEEKYLLLCANCHTIVHYVEDE